MNKFISFALATLLATPLFAQKMGMANNDAQTIKQSVTAGEAKISLDYTSITWATGSTMSMLMDKEKGAKARARVNATAKDAPLAAFSSSVDVMIGTVKIPAGEYKVGFTINDNLDWEMSFMGKETIAVKLDLQDNKAMPHKRLLCSLYAGDESNTVGVYVAFGEKVGMLTIAPAKKA